MKKPSIFALISSLLFLASFTSCASSNQKTITVASSEMPHALILNNAIRPIVEKHGYSLSVKVLDWTLQNDAVANGEYDANYFQHRPYLETYANNAEYQIIEPIVAVHFEPLRIYRGKAADNAYPSKTSTFEICNDISNEIRALDLLQSANLIEGYEFDANGVPTNLPSNITLVEESLLAASLPDYDFGVLPCNTALTAHLSADPLLPGENDEVADLRANVLAANTKKYQNDSEYRAKIDCLADALLSSSVHDYIQTTWSQAIMPYQKDLRKSG